MVWPDWFLPRIYRGLLLVAFLILVWYGIVLMSNSWMFMSPGRNNFRHRRLPVLLAPSSSDPNGGYFSVMRDAGRSRMTPRDIRNVEGKCGEPVRTLT